MSGEQPQLARQNSKENPYKVKLAVFEGPLDLLLYLIKKEEIDIYDIPIARITEQYLQHIMLMQELDIDIASEFIVMAATLIHIKSKLLLPVINPEAPEAENLVDPREELIHRLLEHKKFKAAAEMLWSRAEVEQAIYTRAAIETDLENPEVAATVLDLVGVFKKILERRQEEIEVEIANDEITLATKIDEIRSILADRNELIVSHLFQCARSRREMVITFLAILELVKESVIRLEQLEIFGEIRAFKPDQQ